MSSTRFYLENSDEGRHGECMVAFFVGPAERDEQINGLVAPC